MRNDPAALRALSGWTNGLLVVNATLRLGWAIGRHQLIAGVPSVINGPIALLGRSVSIIHSGIAIVARASHCSCELRLVRLQLPEPSPLLSAHATARRPTGRPRGQRDPGPGRTEVSIDARHTRPGRQHVHRVAHSSPEHASPPPLFPAGHPEVVAGVGRVRDAMAGPPTGLIQAMVRCGGSQCRWGRTSLIGLERTTP